MPILPSSAPSTIEGIKRLAQRLRRKNWIPHHVALNKAANAAGFDSFTHAHHRLPVRSAKTKLSADASCTVFITAYWKEHPQYGSDGRETLALELRRPLTPGLSAREMNANRHLLTFRLRSADHLECRVVLGHANDARKLVCAAARVLLFIDATGLRPYARTLVQPIQNWHLDRLKGVDHACSWRDAISSSLVHTDEPYSRDPDSPSYASRAGEREDWASRHGLTLTASIWPGMYAPAAGSSLFLLGKDEQAVRRASDSLATLSALPVAEVWGGDSSPYRPVFRSPVEVGSGRKIRPPRDPRLVRVSATSQPYALAVVGQSRRPLCRMPLYAHDEVASLLRRAIGATSYRAGASGRLEYVRCELDNWVQVEYTAEELDQERFSNMYYGDLATSVGRRPSISQRNEIDIWIDRVRASLSQHYIASPPLRTLLRKLDLAKESVGAWPVLS